MNEEKQRVSDEQLNAFLDPREEYEGYKTPLHFDLAKDLREARSELEEKQRILMSTGGVIAEILEVTSGRSINSKSKKVIDKLIEEVAENLKNEKAIK